MSPLERILEIVEKPSDKSKPKPKKKKEVKK